MTGKIDIVFEQLIDWVEGRLAAVDADRMASMVATAGPDVRAQVQWLRSFLQLADSVVLAAPPAALGAELTERFKEFAQAKQQPEVFQRLVAALSFDSAQQPAMAGARAGDMGQTREIVFGTDPLDVALTIHPHGQDPHFNLLGQILPNDEALIPDVFAVQLVRDGYEVTIMMADEMGEFGFTTVESGSYWLVLSSDTLEVTLPAFSLTR